MNTVLTLLPTWFQVNPFVGGLLLLGIADVLTGWLCAIRYRRVDSSISREGLTRKAGLLMLVLICKALELSFMRGMPVAETTAMGLCITEGFSLIENFDQLGIKVPYLTQFFARLGENKHG